MSLEYKCFKFKAEDSEYSDSTRVVKGYASTYDLDLGKDRIVKGAFKDTLKNRKGRIKFLYQHDPSQIIGIVKELREDDKGLYCELEFFDDPSVPEAQKAYFLAKKGVIDSFSIGYKVVRSKWVKDEENDKEDDILELHELKLYEVSLVTFPMNEAALVTSIKKETQMPDEKEELPLKVTVEVEGLKEFIEEVRCLVAKMDAKMTALEQTSEVNEVTEPEAVEAKENPEDVTEKEEVSLLKSLQELNSKLNNLKINFTEEK